MQVIAVMKIVYDLHPEVRDGQRTFRVALVVLAVVKIFCKCLFIIYISPVKVCILCRRRNTFSAQSTSDHTLLSNTARRKQGNCCMILQQISVHIGPESYY